MMKNFTLIVVLLAAASLMAACSGASKEANTSGTNTSGTNTSGTAPTGTNTSKTAETTSGALSDPKGSIAHQFDLVKAGDVEKLKNCMTARVKDGVTQEVVDKAKTDAAKYTMDDLFASAEMGEADGKKTAKIKMKNGRTLTTLVETDGKWLADTIWFK